jgi:23S rRNA pseudouridine1911/1915/1917 synthase
MPQLTATASDRLDKTLAAGTGMSRSAAQKLIEAGLVAVNGIAVRESKHPCNAGDAIAYTEPATPHTTPQPEAIPLDVIYEDDALLVINKPAGMSVHPGAGTSSGTVLNALLAHAPSTAEMVDDERPGIVHRLDKETSGVMLLAKTQAAQDALQAQFQARSIEKRYLALCIGRVTPEKAVINKPLGRDVRNRQRMAVVAGGREAITAFEVLRTLDAQAGGSYSLLECRPRTGRTHQIRVHLASIGHPVVGDAVYGGARTARDPLSQRLTPRHLLHAQRIAFAHPVDGRRCDFEAPLPQDFSKILTPID